MASRCALALVLCLSAAEVALGQRVNFGRCPQVKPMKDFDINRFSGEWTEVERSFYIVESAVACTRVNFTIENNETLKAEVSYKTPWRGISSKSMYKADITDSNPGEIELMLQTILPNFVARLTPGSGKYTVLDTDYEEYALIYSCTGFRFLHADFIWVLGRKSDISVNMRAKVYAVLDKFNIDRERLILTQRQDC